MVERGIWCRVFEFFGQYLNFSLRANEFLFTNSSHLTVVPKDFGPNFVCRSESSR